MFLQFLRVISPNSCTRHNLRDFTILISFLDVFMSTFTGKIETWATYSQLKGNKQNILAKLKESSVKSKKHENCKTTSRNAAKWKPHTANWKTKAHSRRNPWRPRRKCSETTGHEQQKIKKQLNKIQDALWNLPFSDHHQARRYCIRFCSALCHCVGWLPVVWDTKVDRW